MLHIIVITEIIPPNSRYELQQVEIILNGYELFVSNLHEGNDRGYVLYFDKTLNPIISQAKHKHKDAVWCEINMINRDKMLMGCVYQSLNSTREKKHESKYIVT